MTSPGRVGGVGCMTEFDFEANAEEEATLDCEEEATFDFVEVNSP